MKTIEQLRAELAQIGERLGDGVTPCDGFTMPVQPDGFATPWLEIKGQEYHFVVCERGIEIARKVTRSDDELLYWFADCGVSALASRLTTLNNASGQAFTRACFRRQFYLMLSIRPAWATRKKKEFAALDITRNR